jgi:signal transduction histidine kinase
MMPRLTVARRIALTILLGLFGSVLLVTFFSLAYWHFADERKPASGANTFPVSALLAESSTDPALRARILGVLKHHSPSLELAVYTESGDLVGTTMAEPFAPPDVGRVDWSSSAFIETKGKRKVEVIPVVTASGARFYALQAEPDKPASAALAWWFWLSCAIPIAWSVVLALLLARSITGPLERIIQTSRALAAGDLSARVGLGRRDELGLLASTLDLMADRIENLLRARTELLALVSHELRTPLARIRVALDIGVDGDVDSAQRALSDIGVDLAELERLLGDTLAYSRLELVDKGGEGTPMNLEEVDPAPLLEEAVHRFGKAWAGRSLLLELEPDLPLLDADRALLMRVVLNLLENAAKYSPADQPIVVRASGVGDSLVVEVIDRGEGIDGPDLIRAFEPFFRARRAQGGATSSGLGLGLTLCRRVVEAHRGTIEARSVPHQGTTMRILLPGASDRAVA